MSAPRAVHRYRRKVFRFTSYMSAVYGLPLTICIIGHTRNCEACHTLTAKDRTLFHNRDGIFGRRGINRLLCLPVARSTSSIYCCFPAQEARGLLAFRTLFHFSHLRCLAVKTCLPLFVSNLCLLVSETWSPNTTANCSFHSHASGYLRAQRSTRTSPELGAEYILRNIQEKSPCP